MSEFGLRMALLELVQYNDVDEDFTFDPSLGGHERIIRRVRLSADNTEYDDLLWISVVSGCNLLLVMCLLCGVSRGVCHLRCCVCVWYCIRVLV